MYCRLSLGKVQENTEQDYTAHRNPHIFNLLLNWTIRNDFDYHTGSQRRELNRRCAG